jgi:hypothetical protein
MFRLLMLAPAVVVLGLLAPGGAAAEPKHPHIHRALFEMREAHRELKEANHNFGGHRDEALEALDVGIKQLEKALELSGDAYKGFVPPKGLYDDYKNHPHLRHSLVEMREALKELKEAAHNFGGHRERAVGALEVAIKETEKCVQAATELKFPHLHRSLFEMREAEKELKEAKHNFGGHRDVAVTALDLAINEMEKALEGVNDPYKGFTPPKGLYDSYKNHPHLRHSLVEMREARKELKEANHNFAGHREKAADLLDVAIQETEKCIEFAK